MSVLARSEGRARQFDTRRFRFELLSLLGWTALCAIALALPRQPFLAGVLIFSYLLLRWSPLSPNHSVTVAVVHNSLVGIAGGLAIAAVALVVSMTLGDEAAARAAFGILTGPPIGMIVGCICAVVRRR